jgi:hypothetical protein
MPPPFDPNNPPRVFIIQTPPRPGPPGSVTPRPNLVLDYTSPLGLASLILREHERPTPARQKFRVYWSGHIQNVEAGNVGLGDNGYLTRVQVGTTVQLRLVPYDLDYNPLTPTAPHRQVWNFNAGPTPKSTSPTGVGLDLGDPARVPGGGPSGNEKYTIVVDRTADEQGVPNPSPRVLSAVQVGGRDFDVLPTAIPEVPGDPALHRRLPNEQLFYFYWLPGD